MSYQVVRYETTPNPNAIKCWIDRPLSSVPQSFLNAEMAETNPLAEQLFSKLNITTLLFNGEWFTINKSPEARWPTVKRALEKILIEFDSDSGDTT